MKPKYFSETLTRKDIGMPINEEYIVAVDQWTFLLAIAFKVKNRQLIVIAESIAKKMPLNMKKNNFRLNFKNTIEIVRHTFSLKID